MAEKLSPVFRKSINGYNREDVNDYIKRNDEYQRDLIRDYDTMKEDLTRRLDTEKEYRDSAESALAKTKDRLECATVEIADKDEKIAALTGENDVYKTLLEEKDGEIATLKARIAELEEAAASCDDAEKAEYYDSICSKAGEILFIASDTAEEILNRANDEAQKIVGDATTKKELMLKTLSKSVDEATGDINVYIKRAVDDCIKKINKSVSEAGKAVAPASRTAPEKAKVRKPVIINVK